MFVVKKFCSNHKEVREEVREMREVRNFAAFEKRWEESVGVEVGVAGEVKRTLEGMRGEENTRRYER